jgi:hypothetical protein
VEAMENSLDFWSGSYLGQEYIGCLAKLALASRR